MSKSITVAYELHPPPNTNAANLTPTKAEEFPVKDNRESQKDYYEGLRAAIDRAKSMLGEDLTVWRDAVGVGELGQTKKILKEDDGEDEDEDERT